VTGEPATHDLDSTFEKVQAGTALNQPRPEGELSLGAGSPREPCRYRAQQSLRVRGEFCRALLGHPGDA
jgi:hypothetical protein